MATLELTSVGKTFGQKPVLDGVDLKIADGEFVSLVGPSGCGKSTLLRMIAGLETIGSGTISIDGRAVNTVAAKDRDVAMVFQNYALYPHMTVFENMSFALETRGMPKAEITAAVSRAAEILGLSALLGRLPRELSGGQQQRVAMGRAIVRKPKIFLFDEPLSNLDAQLRVQMRAEIKELHAELGVTIVYVTHDQLEAMTMSDRIVVLKSGCVEQVGSPLELYDLPRTEFVATFIGSPAMNLINGRVTADACYALPDGLGLDIGPIRASGTADTIHLGIRPEDLVPAEAGISGRVVVVEPSGAETQIILETGWGARISALVRGRATVSRGDTLHLKPDPKRLHVFDASTGIRLN